MEMIEMIEIPKQEYEALKGLVASLTAKVAELEARLNKNSKNSDKPPSSDGPRKSAVKNNRTPSGRTSGGQKGHEGKTLELRPNPDTVVELKPQEICACGGHIIVRTEDYTVRQVIDIAPVKVLTVEYRAHEGMCDTCAKVHKASFPQGIDNPASYGDQLSAIVTYLTAYQLLPLQRATELVADLFGTKVSQGLIVARGQEAYAKLSETEDRVKEEILASTVVNCDETGARVKGKTCWLHSAGTQNSTVYNIHEKRGKDAMEAMGILPRYTGTIVHDHWKSYYHYDQCSHAECNAHHLRHLKYLHEDLGEAWAGDMASLLLRIKKHVDLSKLFGADQLEQADIDTYERLYREILVQATAAFDTSPTQRKEVRRMINRMKEYEAETLLFMLDFEVPFTNNLAERDIRMPKTKQKISGGFRTEKGAKAFARIRGFISTTKKKRKNVLDGLIAVFGGNATDFLYPKT